MSFKFFVVSKARDQLPACAALLADAWGDLPVSYMQGDENLNKASFIDAKVNKWEVNRRWGDVYGIEPTVRVELLKGDALKTYVTDEKWVPEVDLEADRLVVLERDEGGSEIDDVLAIALLSVFARGGECYRLEEGLYRLGEAFFSALPSKDTIRAAIEAGPEA